MLLYAGVQVGDLDGKKYLIEQWISEYISDNDTDEGSGDEDESRDSGNAAVGQHVNVVALLSVVQQLEEGVPVPKKRDFPSSQVEKAQCKHCHEIHGAHLKQCEVARRLFEKMIDGIQSMGSKSSAFDDFEVFILVPNLNSLYNQTVTRLEKFRKDIQSKKNSGGSDSAPPLPLTSHSGVVQKQASGCCSWVTSGSSSRRSSRAAQHGAAAW